MLKKKQKWGLKLKVLHEIAHNYDSTALPSKECTLEKTMDNSTFEGDSV